MFPESESMFRFGRTFLEKGCIFGLPLLFTSPFGVLRSAIFQCMLERVSRGMLGTSLAPTPTMFQACVDIAFEYSGMRRMPWERMIEGRNRLRYARGSLYAVIPRFPKGKPFHDGNLSPERQTPGEVKHLSSRRNRNQPRSR